MDVLWGAFIALAIMASAINLLLTAGVIRRLREHTDRLGELAGVPPMVSMQPADGRIGRFAARSSRNRAVTSETLSGAVLVGAFAEGCPMCQEALPGFVDLARRIPGGPEQVMALLVGRSAGMARERRRLEPVAQVVEEEVQAAVSNALGVQGFPAIGVINADTGAVLVAGTRVDQVKRFMAPSVLR